jgi:hypothetical protein
MLYNYSSFLLESSTDKRIDTTVLTDEQVVNLIINNCKDFKWYHEPLLRRNNLVYDYLLIDPKLHTRKSINISNYYTLLIDNSPYWKDFPKRSNSLMGAVEGLPNTIFGRYLFQVIPFDGAKFGVAPSYDLWSRFNYLKIKTGMGIKEIVDFLEYISNKFKININDSYYKLFKKDMVEVEKIIKSTDIDELFKIIGVWDYPQSFIKLLKENIDNGVSFIDFINKYIKPNDNNFKLMNYEQLINNNFPENENGYEFWTDSKCILVETHTIKNIKELYDKKI